MKRTLLSALLLLAASASAQSSPTALNVAIAAEPPLLDPTASPSAEIARVFNLNVMQGLLTANAQGKIVPLLASSYSISPDGLTYTFKLRTGVKFHDGSAFGADDVVAALNRARDPKSGHTHPEYYASIKSVTAQGQGTVVVKLSQADNDLLFNLSRSDSVIGPKGKEAAQKTNPIGTGPFKFSAWNRGSSIELTKFDGYWDKSLPKLSKVTFKIIPDLNAQLAALKAGDVDVIGYGVGPENIPAIKADPTLQLLTGGSTTKMTIGLNNSAAPFNDLRVRQALAYATNKPEIVQGLFFGQGVAIGSHRTPSETDYVDLKGAYPYNPDKAKALLKAAGYTDQKPLTFTFDLPAQYQNEVRIGQAVAAQWAKVGIKAQVRSIEFSTWLTKIYTNADYQATVIGHVEANDIGIYANPKYYFRYNSAKFQATFKKYQSGSPTQAAQAMKDLQKTLSDDAVNDWVMEFPTIVALKKGVTGWAVGSPIESLDVTRVGWQK